MFFFKTVILRFIKSAKRIGLNFYRCFADINIVVKKENLSREWDTKLSPGNHGWLGCPTNGYAEHRSSFFLERMGFFYLPEVTNHEIIVLFWYLQRVCSFLSILYFCPVMGSGMDNICCTVLGHGCTTGAYPRKTKD